MSPEQLSPQQIVFFKCTQEMGQNLSQLLAQKGEIVSIENLDRPGEQVNLRTRGMKTVMFGLYQDMQGLGFTIEEAKDILNPRKSTALGLKKG